MLQNDLPWQRGDRGAARMTSSSFLKEAATVMMGIRERRFEPLPREFSLEDLVPKDDFYRWLEATLDLSFVREMVRPL